jgi:hypothetical protein
MFNIVALNESHYDMMGIYRIWFGCKFYIGATTNTTNRIIAHEAAIKRCLSGIGIGRNSQTNIANHLLANQSIETAFLELLEPCSKEIDLVDAEHDWLCNFKDNSDCLNVNFQVSRVIAGIIVRPNGEIRIKENGKYIHIG